MRVAREAQDMVTRAETLTPRVLDILRLIACGCTDKEIAARLGRGTVSNHVSVILLKLGAANRAEAVAIAVRDGIIDLPPPRLDEDQQSAGFYPGTNPRGGFHWS